MNTLLTFAVSYLLNALWQVSLIATCAWMASRVLRPVGAHAQQSVWLAASALGVVVPALPRWQWLWQQVYHSAPALAPTLHLRLVAHTAQFAHQSVPAMLASAIALAYMGTLLLCAWRLLLSLLGTAAIVRKSTPAQLEPAFQLLWAPCCERFSLPAVTLLVSQQLAAPAACGLRAPAILLPARLIAEGCAEDLLAALAHESAHIARRDFARNLAYEILTLPIAWHPAAWLLRSHLAQTRELLCDRLAVDCLAIDRLTAASPADTLPAQGQPGCSPPVASLHPHGYARSLLRLSAAAAHLPQPIVSVGILDGNILETRIMAITYPHQRLRPAATRFLVASAVLLIGSAALAATACAFNVQAAPSTASNPLGAVYAPGKGIVSPKIISSVDPSFPKEVHTSRAFQGVSVIGIVVDRTGLPRDLRVLHSLTPAFDEQALKAVRQFRFQPATKDGKPVAASLTVEVNFQRF